jgi:hypothetical protein
MLQHFYVRAREMVQVYRGAREAGAILRRLRRKAAYYSLPNLLTVLAYYT